MPFDRNRRFDNRRGGFSGGRGGGRSFDRGPREMHKAICSECGKECEVPFKPTEGKPVFCRECFAKKRPRRF
jgi:CxxC-x17-CxxC domain-containing protein